MLTWVSLLFELKYDACQNLLNRRGDATAWAVRNQTSRSGGRIGRDAISHCPYYNG